MHLGVNVNNMVGGGFASNIPSLVAGGKICSKGRKSAKQDLRQDLVGGIKDRDGSKVRAI